MGSWVSWSLGSFLSLNSLDLAAGHAVRTHWLERVDLPGSAASLILHSQDSLWVLLTGVWLSGVWPHQTTVTSSTSFFSVMLRPCKPCLCVVQTLLFLDSRWLFLKPNFVVAIVWFWSQLFFSCRFGKIQDIGFHLDSHLLDNWRWGLEGTGLVKIKNNTMPLRNNVYLTKFLKSTPWFRSWN